MKEAEDQLEYVNSVVRELKQDFDESGAMRNGQYRDQFYRKFKDIRISYMEGDKKRVSALLEEKRRVEKDMSGYDYWGAESKSWAMKNDRQYIELKNRLDEIHEGLIKIN